MTNSRMDDLISRAALLVEFRSLCGPQTGDGWDNMGVHNLIMRQKAVDAVPVVRCKDCRHRGSNAICVKLWVGTKDSFFCAFGERRDSE